MPLSIATIIGGCLPCLPICAERVRLCPDEESWTLLNAVPDPPVRYGPTGPPGPRGPAATSVLAATMRAASPELPASLACRRVPTHPYSSPTDVARAHPHHRSIRMRPGMSSSISTTLLILLRGRPAATHGRPLAALPERARRRGETRSHDRWIAGPRMVLLVTAGMIIAAAGVVLLGQAHARQALEDRFALRTALGATFVASYASDIIRREQLIASADLAAE